MANKYFYSGSAGASSPYESEATAATNLDTLAETTGIWSDGDKILCQSDDAMSEASSVITTPVSTSFAYPRNFVSVSDLTTPTTMQYGFTWGTVSGGSISIRDMCNFYGFHFYPGNSGTAGSTSAIILGSTSTTNNIQNFYNCIFESGYSGSSTVYVLTIGASSSTVSFESVLANCTIVVKNSTHYGIRAYGGNVLIDNLTISLPGSVPTYFVSLQNSFYGNTIIQNSDFSSIEVAYFLNATNARGGKIYLKKCKFHASTSLSYQLGLYVGLELYIMNCDLGSTHVYYQRYGAYGLLTFDTGIYATTNPMTTKDETPCSIRLDANSYVGNSSPISTEWISEYAEGGVEITLDVEVLVSGDGATALTNKELWLEVCYMGDTTYQLGSCATTQETNILASASTVSAGTTSWTGDGYSVERTHKLSLTFTPEQDGNYQYRVCLGKTSATVYVNIP